METQPLDSQPGLAVVSTPASNGPLNQIVSSNAAALQPDITMSQDQVGVQQQQEANAQNPSPKEQLSDQPQRARETESAPAPSQPQPQSQSQPQPHPPTQQPSHDLPSAPTAASPPLPPKHLPVTPGPRATRLQELFATSLKHTLNKISWENMAACYPTIAANAPNLLRDVRNTMVARLQERCHKEFDKIMTGRQVVPKLNELENLVSEAASRRVLGDGLGENAQPPIPPHQLPAEAIVAAHLSRPLAAQRSQLNARLQNNQALNERLYAEIEAQRSEIEGLLSVLERTLTDVDGANSLLAGIVDEIAREARDVEVEITGV